MRADFSPSIGEALRQGREARGISLEELSRLTRIPAKQLALVERDAFSRLPGSVFIRGFIRAHARTVGADADALLASFDTAHAPSLPSATGVPATVLPDAGRGRRFGVAIAVVVLLILFTLALSIVLQPRQRTQPTELSRVTASAPLARG